MVNDPYKQYKESQIKTSDQGRLIIMLYDGAVRFIQTAADNVSAKKYDIVNNNLIRAQDILIELMISINLKMGDVAKNLYSIYEYMNRRLIEANINKDQKIMEEVIKLLKELREAWNEAVKKTGETTVKYKEGGINIEG